MCIYACMLACVCKISAFCEQMVTFSNGLLSIHTGVDSYTTCVACGKQDQDTLISVLGIRGYFKMSPLHCLWLG